MASVCRSLGAPSARSARRSGRVAPRAARRAVVVAAAPARRAAFPAGEASVEEDGNVIQCTSAEQWEQIKAESGSGDLVLDISTTTCGPCKLVYPHLVKLSEEYADVTFVKLNGDANAETRAMMKDWGVRAVPTFRYYRGGEQVKETTGGNPEKLRDAVKDFVGR